MLQHVTMFATVAVHTEENELTNVWGACLRAASQAALPFLVTDSMISGNQIYAIMRTRAAPVVARSEYYVDLTSMRTEY